MNIIEKNMLGLIDGIECWHSRHDKATTEHYLEFCRKHRLLTTGGSDCHQKPIIMGTVEMGEKAAEGF
jgi:predicted metal-dependent phosphoesterase TrpH